MYIDIDIYEQVLGNMENKIENIKTNRWIMKKIKLLLSALLLISIIIIPLGCEDNVTNNGGSTDTNPDTNPDIDKVPTTYTVTVINKSTQSGNFIIYQIFPEQKTNSKLYSLAWETKTLHTNQKTIFQWNDNYSFMWAETGKLSIGNNVTGAITKEIKDADPSDPTKNIITLTKKGDVFLFENSTTTGENNKLTIQTDNKIINDVTSVGIARNDKPVIAMNASINEIYKFTPAPTYWIIFGGFKEGEVLDLTSIHHPTKNLFSKPMEIVFPLNVDKISITFKEDNTWEVTTGSN